MGEERIDIVFGQSGAEKVSDSMKGMEKSSVDADKSIKKLNKGITNNAKVSPKAVSANKKLGNSLRTFQQRADKSAKSIGGLNKGLSILPGSFASLGVIFGAQQIISTLVEFEDTMATLAGVTRATDAEFKRLSNTAREVGATTRFSATEAGQGLLFLSRAGFDVNQSIDALPSTLNLATVGMLSLGEAADIASNVVSQFGLEAKETERVVDALTIVSNRSNTDVRQLAEALKFAGPVAGALGISVEETAAAIGVLGDSGIQASLAGTNLRGILSAILGPSKKAQTIFKKLGISINDINPATKTLSEIFGTLKEAGLDASDALDIFGRRNVSAALALTNTAGKISDLNKATKEFSGESKDIAKRLENTLGGSLKALVSTFQELILQAGDKGLGGSLKGLVDTVTDVLRVLAGAEDEVKGNAAVAKTLATAIEGVVFALKAMIALKLVSYFGKLNKIIRVNTKLMIRNGVATNSLSGSVRGLGRNLKAVGAIAVAIGAADAISKMIKLRDEFDKLGKSIEKNEEIGRDRFEKLRNQIKETNRSFSFQGAANLVTGGLKETKELEKVNAAELDYSTRKTQRVVAIREAMKMNEEYFISLGKLPSQYKEATVRAKIATKVYEELGFTQEALNLINADSISQYRVLIEKFGVSSREAGIFASHMAKVHGASDLIVEGMGEYVRKMGEAIEFQKRQNAIQQQNIIKDKQRLKSIQDITAAMEKMKNQELAQAQEAIAPFVASDSAIANIDASFKLVNDNLKQKQMEILDTIKSIDQSGSNLLVELTKKTLENSNAVLDESGRRKIAFFAPEDSKQQVDFLLQQLQRVRAEIKLNQDSLKNLSQSQLDQFSLSVGLKDQELARIEQQAQRVREIDVNSIEQIVQRHDILVELERQKEARISAIKQQGEQERVLFSQMSTQQQISIVANGASQIASSLQALNQAAFDNNKEFAIGLAVINTAAAITNALATVQPFFPAAIAAATSAGIMGAAQIATITKAQPGVSMTPTMTGASATTPSTDTGAQQNVQNITVDIITSGDNSEAIRTLIDDIAVENQTGGVQQNVRIR